METKEIDYTELNDRIVMQAIEKANFHIDEEMLARLLQGKIARAKAVIDQRDPTTKD
jgi:hypothetical protein